LSKDEPQDVYSVRTERSTNSELMRPLAHTVSASTRDYQSCLVPSKRTLGTGRPYYEKIGC